MPNTFAGAYIQEPDDLRIVCTERDIIVCCDDPGGESARSVTTFATLTANQKAAIVAVMNTLIEQAEAEINSYARRQGYLIPLNPVDPDVTAVVARWIWVSMRQRAKTAGFSSAEAESQRKALRDGPLSDIATGRKVLTAAKDTAKAPLAHVYSITDAASRDTDGQVPRMSRGALEAF